jgi:hypothetical protein
MKHAVRLHLIGRITYYIGWVALLCGGLLHLNIATTLFLALNLTKRNLFEVSIVCFLICIASELRAQVVPGNELSSSDKK